MARVCDAAVGDDGHAVLRSRAGYPVHRGRLGAPAGAHLLRRADGPASHADTEAVCAGRNELQRLRTRDDVPCNDFELGVRRLEVLDHVDLQSGM